MEPIIDNVARDCARVLWNYHHLDLGLHPCDFVLALGSHDDRVGREAARLVLKGFAPLLIPSGGFGKVTQTIWGITEGERFAEIARELGVEKSKILVENTASNTGENITKTRELLQKQGLHVRNGILVTKPYMRRRAYATASKQWPEMEWLVSSPALSFEEYPDQDVPERRMIELMVGDLQRIKLYAERGYQIPQEIPQTTWKCYEDLVQLGFDKYVIKQSAGEHG
jgi:uncharacterized SAM-binding protein YcdF (DUF218 family)